MTFNFLNAPKMPIQHKLGKERTLPYNLDKEKSRVYKYNLRKDQKIEAEMKKRSHLAGTVSLMFVKHQNAETVLESQAGLAAALPVEVANLVFAYLEKYLKYNPVNSQYHFHGSIGTIVPDAIDPEIFISEAQNAFFDHKKVPTRLLSLYKAFKKFPKDTNMRLANAFSQKSIFFKAGKNFSLATRWQIAIFNAFASITITDEDYIQIIDSAVMFMPEKMDFIDVLDARRVWLMTNRISTVSSPTEINPQVS